MNYFIAPIVTFYCLDKEHVTLLSYKVHRSANRNIIPDKIVSKYTEEILAYVLHDAERCLAIEQFEPVKANTHCVFAKTAKLWGSRDYDVSLSLEENVKRLVAQLRVTLMIYRLVLLLAMLMYATLLLRLNNYTFHNITVMGIISHDFIEIITFR